ncbi:MAG TPA: DUF2062 domain-containing protein [Candidatus Acidoferrales bacterium]|nr:DUF2062 domain-containing protein [Candidatus Acidoferrales bacterium]
MKILRKILAFLRGLLQQGLSPEKIALCLALGIAITSVPISFGLGTALCAAAALAFRLNLPAIQAANWAASPLQLLLFIPYMRAGEFLTRAKPLPLSIGQITAMFRADLWGSLVKLWGSILRATLGWAVLAPLEVLVIYAVLVPLLRLIPALPRETAASAAVPSTGSPTGKDS